MTKPIALIRIDNHILRTDNLHELWEMFEKKLPDYNVLVVPTTINNGGGKEVIELEVFWVEKITDIDLERLKDYITTLVKNKDA